VHKYQYKKKYFLLLFGLLLSSCSSPIGVYFSTRYDNVMGYFNTYYNARNTYNEAVLLLEKNNQASKDTNYFTPYQVAPDLKTKFGIVIEKASKIIQFYPRSKWVDDAIMMIGKTYFYQNDFNLALKKFNELIENFPNSDYIWEAKLLVGWTLYDAGKMSDAQSYLNMFLSSAPDKIDKDIAIQGYMLLGQIHSNLSEYLKAIESYKKALEIDGNGYYMAISAFQLARCYELGNDYENSNKFYLKVLDYNPSDNMKFKASLNYGKTLREIQKYTEALNEFNDLRSEAFNKDQLSQIDLEIANTYGAMDDYNKALDQYELVDSLYQKTDASAKSFYNRGLLYEFKLIDYTEAKFYYDKAQTEFTQSDITQLATKKSNAFERYFNYYKDISKYDSLLHAAVNRATIKPGENSLSIDSLSGFSDSLNKEDSLSEKDSLVAKSIPSETSNIKESNDTLGLVESGNLEDSSKLGSDIGLNISADSIRKHSQKLISSKPFVSSDSAMFMILKNQFELATLFLLDLSQPDSAEFWFDLVANSTYKNVFAARALYALAELKRFRNDRIAMDSLYNCIVDNFPNSEYATQIKKIRGLPVEKQKTDYEQLYEDGLKLIDQNKPKESLLLLSQIIQSDTSNKIALKAIYTSGWVYENILNNNDSAKTFYKFLIDRYPNSVYASDVIGKIAVYEDTANLSKYVKFKEIVAPPPPVPKYSTTDQEAKTKNEQIDENPDQDQQDQNPPEDVPEPEPEAEESPN
jgi:tetratricopeptide (TPR) repeat protein